MNDFFEFLFAGESRSEGLMAMLMAWSGEFARILSQPQGRILLPHPLDEKRHAIRKRTVVFADHPGELETSERALQAVS